MAKEIITVNGKDFLVREDRAKAFRAFNWMSVVFTILLAILIFVLANLFFLLFFGDSSETPEQIQNSVSTGR